MIKNLPWVASTGGRGGRGEFVGVQKPGPKLLRPKTPQKVNSLLSEEKRIIILKTENKVNKR